TTANHWARFNGIGLLRRGPICYQQPNQPSTASANLMSPLPATARQSRWAAVFAGLAFGVAAQWAHSARADSDTNEVRIVELRGRVEIFRKGAIAGVWTETPGQALHPHDRLVVGTNSHVTLRWS